jgi:hypothetical protein
MRLVVAVLVGLMVMAVPVDFLVLTHRLLVFGGGGGGFGSGGGGGGSKFGVSGFFCVDFKV